jgi:hypothetical protein
MKNEFSNNHISKVREVVNNAFQFAFDKRYDSLSLIMPDFYFTGVNESYLPIKFKELERSIALGDLPSVANTKVFSESINGYPGIVLTFYPDRDLYQNDSLRIFQIDSIRFFFMEPIGFERISFFEVFAPIPLLKPIN